MRGTLKVDEVRLEVGGLASIPVRLLGAPGLANIDFTVSFDPGVVTPAAAPSPGGDLPAAAVQAGNAGERGLLRISLADARELGPDGVLVTLPLRAQGAAGSRTPLTVRVQRAQDAQGRDVALATWDGGVLVAASGTRGDCDGDGQVTRADAACMVRMAAGALPQDPRVDVDGDGRVTSGDARWVLQQAR